MTLSKRPNRSAGENEISQGGEHCGQTGTAPHSQARALVFCRRQQADELAEILLMDATHDTLRVRDPVITRDQQIGAFACAPSRDLGRRQSAQPRKNQAEGLFLNAACKPPDVRLQDVRGGRTADWDGDLAACGDIDRQLVLNARERHRHTMFANLKRALGKLVNDAFERGAVRHDAEIISGSAWFAERESSRGIPAEVHQKADNVLRRHLEPQTEFGEMRFRQEISEPRDEPATSIGAPLRGVVSEIGNALGR
jgi:hypothetical protein